MVVVGEVFKKTILKRKKGDGQGCGESMRETSRTRGDEKKEQGIQQAAIKRGKRERKKDWRMRRGSHRIERGKGFLKCSVQISL